MNKTQMIKEMKKIETKINDLMTNQLTPELIKTQIFKDTYTILIIFTERKNDICGTDIRNILNIDDRLRINSVGVDKVFGGVFLLLKVRY